MHWPVDVLGGIVFGTVCVLLADFAFEYAQRKKMQWVQLLLLIPVLVAAYVWRDSDDLVKTVGTFSGFLAGYSVESSFIRFDAKATFLKQAVKFALGIAVVLALKEGLKLLFPQAPAFDFMRYLVLGLWITVGAPFVFKLLRLSKVELSQEEKSAGL